MGVLVLLIVALISAGSVVYLVTYAPIKMTFLGQPWSPRLIICKLLIPVDIVLTISLIVLPMFLGVQGIMTFTAGVFTAAGLSGGVVFIKRVMVPRWRRKYQEAIAKTPVNVTYYTKEETIHI